MSDRPRRLHHRTCNLCEAMCGLEIELEGAEIVAIRGDRDDPFSRGHICPKAVALQDVWADPDRLRRPVRRVGSDWREISWDEAFRRVADGLGGVIERHGRAAVGVYLGNPNVHNLGSMLVLRTLLKSLRTPNLFTATSVDQLPHHVAARLMFGHYFLLPVPDVDRTDFFLVLGANPTASNGSLMTAPGIDRRLDAIRERGGRVVLVDPRRTETAARADRHLFIRPGTDVLLLAAILRTLFAEDLARTGRLESSSDGLEGLAALFEPFSPARVAPLTGLPAADIEALARDFAAAPSAVCYGRIGLSTQAFGGTCQWLINLINLVTGNLDRAGGAMFPRPAFDIVTAASRGKMNRWQSRVRGLPERFGELPAATMAEEMLTPGDGKIRAMLTVAGNPVLSTPNGGRLDQAFAELDFCVAIDIYVNETTRHADVVLPPTTGLECDHYDVIFHTLAVRNTAKYSPALFPPVVAGANGDRADGDGDGDGDGDDETDREGDGAMHDWQIFRRLAKLLAPANDPVDETAPANAATPDQMLDFGLRSGPYDLTLEALKAAPHGIDLGPLEPCLPDRLFTDNGRIDAAPEPFSRDLGRAEDLLAETGASSDGFDLALIGRRHLASNNSWMHNAERLVKGRDRCTLMIHPDDAAARGIGDGERVTIGSRVGEIELPAQVTDDIMPGVVSIPHGFGHGRAGVRLRVAAQHAGASINDLTDDQRIDPVTGNAALSAVPVRVGLAARPGG